MYKDLNEINSTLNSQAYNFHNAHMLQRTFLQLLAYFVVDFFQLALV